jgi:hypothetical protein
MPAATGIRGWITADPRHGQIATLATLLAYGVSQLAFDLTAAQAVVTIGTALAVQRLGDWQVGAPWRSGAKSALISSLSLCLLLRTDDLDSWPHALSLPRFHCRFPMTRPIALLLLALTATCATAAPAAAFCGFVAKVNLQQQSALGFSTLRPLQVAYESPTFMLPIRLGMVNADGAQELFVYTLTRRGRVETTNYRAVTLQTDLEMSSYLKDPAEFGKMDRAMFDQHARREGMRAVFQEYAWDMSWCDPCATDPLSRDELRQLGVSWLEGRPEVSRPGFRRGRPGGQDVFVTRLHVRYDQAHFPEDLVFHETGDRTNFQGRYVLRHAWTGPMACAEGDTYRRALRARQVREAEALASLTGWHLADIRRQGAGPVAPPADPAADAAPWWRTLWK